MSSNSSPGPGTLLFGAVRPASEQGGAEGDSTARSAPTTGAGPLLSRHMDVALLAVGLSLILAGFLLASYGATLNLIGR